MSDNTQNPYAVLALRKGAEEEQIKKAYVELVRKFDPERHPNRFMVIIDNRTSPFVISTHQYLRYIKFIDKFIVIW